MNNYSDLPDINTLISVYIKTLCIGNPDYSVSINGKIYKDNIIDYVVRLSDPIQIEIELKNKTYTLEYETAVIIDQISVDYINIIPQYNQYARYANDHNFTDPTSYLGFNGKWTLTIDRPFYQWLHHVQGQGWLLT